MRQVTENFAMNHITNRENLENLIKIQIETSEESGRLLRETRHFPINPKIKCFLCNQAVINPLSMQCGCIYCPKCYYVTLQEINLHICPIHRIEITLCPVSEDIKAQIHNTQFICPHHIGLRSIIPNNDPQCIGLCNNLDEYQQHLKSNCQSHSQNLPSNQLSQYFKETERSPLKYVLTDKNEIEYIIKSFRETTDELSIITHLFWDRMQIDYNGFTVTSEGHVGRQGDGGVPSFPQIQMVVMANHNVQKSQQNNQNPEEPEESPDLQKKRPNYADEIAVYLVIEPPDEEQLRVVKFIVSQNKLFQEGIQRFTFTINQGIVGRYSIRRILVMRSPQNVDISWKIESDLQLVSAHNPLEQTEPMYLRVDSSAPFQGGIGIGVEAVQRGAVYTLCTQFKEIQFYQQIDQLYIQQNPSGFHQIEKLSPLELNGLLTYLWLTEQLPDVICGILAIQAFLRNRDNLELFMSQSFMIGFGALMDRFVNIQVVQRLCAMVITNLQSKTQNYQSKIIKSFLGRIKLAQFLHGDNEQFKQCLQFNQEISQLGIKQELEKQIYDDQIRKTQQFASEENDTLDEFTKINEEMEEQEERQISESINL